jgi:hypothetical protein
MLRKQETEELVKKRKELVKQLCRDRDDNIKEEPDTSQDKEIPRPELVAPPKIMTFHFLEGPFVYYQEIFRSNWSQMANSWYQNNRHLDPICRKQGIEVNRNQGGTAMGGIAQGVPMVPPIPNVSSPRTGPMSPMMRPGYSPSMYGGRPYAPSYMPQPMINAQYGRMIGTPNNKPIMPFPIPNSGIPQRPTRNFYVNNNPPPMPDNAAQQPMAQQPAAPPSPQSTPAKKRGGKKKGKDSKNQNQ